MYIVVQVYKYSVARYLLQKKSIRKIRNQDRRFINVKPTEKNKIKRSKYLNKVEFFKIKIWSIKLERKADVANNKILFRKGVVSL